jgi:hypothetical protein
MDTRQKVPLKCLRAANASSARTLDSAGLEIIVVFTKMRLTLKALTTARRMGKGLYAAIRLLVPHIVPYGVPLDRPLVATPFLERQFRVMVDGSEMETRVDIRLCRDEWQMLDRVLAPQSVVVLGGPGSRLWPSREGRLAKKLIRAGHHVLLVR